MAHLAQLTLGDITWNGVTVNLWGVYVYPRSVLSSYPNVKQT